MTCEHLLVGGGVYIPNLLRPAGVKTKTPPSLATWANGKRTRRQIPAHARPPHEQDKLEEMQERCTMTAVS